MKGGGNLCDRTSDWYDTNVCKNSPLSKSKRGVNREYKERLWSHGSVASSISSTKSLSCSLDEGEKARVRVCIRWIDGSSIPAGVQSVLSLTVYGDMTYGRSYGCHAGGTMPTIARKKSRKSSARLDVRLRPDKKALIEEAATLSGKTISEYVVSTLLQQSTEVLQRHRHIRLSDRDRDQFLTLLDASDEPSATLTRAVRKYKQAVGTKR